MLVDFDPEIIDVMMDLWRKSLDMEMPLKDELKIQFMQNRRRILENHLRTAKGWQLFMGSLAPTDASRVGFEIANAKVEAFRQWAEISLAELDAL